MIEQLEAVRLPADWATKPTRTSETLVERMRALPDEQLMAFNEDLWLLHDSADQVRDDLEASIRSLMDGGAFILEGNLLVAECTNEGSGNYNAVVVLRDAGLCHELIDPPEVSTPELPVNHVMHVSVGISGDGKHPDFELECLGHDSADCPDKEWFDDEDISETLRSSIWPKDCWPALVEVQWDAPDDPGAEATFHYAGRYWDIELPKEWELAGYVADPQPDEEGLVHTYGIAEPWQPGSWRFVYDGEGDVENDINVQNVFIHPLKRNPLSGDPDDIAAWVKKNYDS